jgi:glycosyltransferase involved in cell wall biosynthesis
VRVLLINAFHYLRGGVERTYFDTSRWLAAAGHDVLHFATRDPRNFESPTARFFAPAADFGPEAPWFSQARQLPRALWSRPAARALERLLAETRPDVAHLHAPSRHLTPSVIRTLDRAGVPMVMTLHDFKPWCTNRILFAHGSPCERCKGGHHVHAFLTGCVQDSRVKSAIGTIEAYLHEALAAYRPIRRWIAPSRFTHDKAIEHGLDPDLVRLVPHGVELRPAAETSRAPLSLPDVPYVLYAGRVAEEKGVRLLPTLALRIAPTPLVVAGGGPLLEWLRHQTASLPGVLPLGHLDEPAFAATLARAAVVVIPSLTYENFCYAAAEALAVARPVVASSRGAIPELVVPERTGLLVAAGDALGLAESVRRALVDPAAASWGAAGREEVATRGAPARHLERLLGVYREAIEAG